MTYALILALLGGCGLQSTAKTASLSSEAVVKMTRDADCPVPTLFGAPLIPRETCGERAERLARDDFGSTEGWAWTATRDVPGLVDGEWFVQYGNAEASAFMGYVTDVTTGQVSDPQRDLFLGHRVGILAVSDDPPLALTDVVAATSRCNSWSNKGWCFEVRGVATNQGDAIIGVNAEAEMLLKVGGKHIDGEYVRRDFDAFRTTSASRPWRTGESRTFGYRSNIVPDVYAEHDGEALGVFWIAVETVAHGKIRSFYVADAVPWPPSRDL